MINVENIKGIQLLTKYERKVLSKNLEELTKDSNISLFSEAVEEEFRINQKPFTLSYRSSTLGDTKGRVLCYYTSNKEKKLLAESSAVLVDGAEYLLEDSDGQRTKVKFDKQGFSTSQIVAELESDKLYRAKSKYLILIKFPSLNFWHVDNMNRVSYFGNRTTTKVLDLQGNLVWKGLVK
jgi:hypothetical protein